MGSKHTSGPWERIIFQGGKKGFKIVAGKKPWTEHVATANEIFMDRGEREANARLIAASPEMYDLLKEMNGGHLSFSEFDKRSKSLLNRIDNEQTTTI